MSYSKLILKDRPDIVWALDDINESSSVSYPINFFSTSASVYSASINASTTNILQVPIVFGGGTALKLNSSSVAGLSIPALNRFSELYSSKKYALEFWLRCDKVPSIEVPIVKKRNFTNMGLFLKENYLIYRYGNSASYIECSYALGELDEPTHIVMNYTNGSIELLVNGVSSKVENYNGTVLPIDGSHSINDFLDFYGNENYNCIIDSVSIYPFPLSANKAKTHYVYGLGKSIDESVFFNMGGDYYNLSTKNTQKSYFAYWDFPQEWELMKYDNLSHTNSGVTTINYGQPTLGSVDNNLTNTSNQIYFSSSVASTNGSYIDIDNISSILLNGNPLFAKIKFNGNLPSSGSSQTIMSYGIDPFVDVINFNLKNTSGSYYVQVVNNNTASFLSFYVPSITSSPTVYIGMKYNSQSIFYFSMSGSSLQTASFTTYSGSVFGSDPFADYFPPRDNAVLRIGSNNSYNVDLTASPTSSQFLGTFLKFFVGKNDFSASTYSAIDSYSTPKYEFYYNTSASRFIVSSFGNANFIVHGARIANTNDSGSAIIGSNRFEFGYPEVVSGSQVSLYATLYDYSNNVVKAKTQIGKISNFEWLNLINMQNKFIKFDIDILSKDNEFYPPFVKYFKSEVYSDTSSYVQIFDDGGSFIRIKNGASAQSYLPEFYETPSVFITDTSGIRVNKNFVELDFNKLNIGTLGFFIKFNTAASAAFKFIEIFSSSTAASSLFSASTNSSNQISLSSSSATFYINGTASNAVYNDQWLHATFTFNPKLFTSSTTNFLIRFGDSVKSDFNIQNIYILDTLIEATEVLYLHNAFTGASAIITSASTRPVISAIDKNENSHSSSFSGYIYQPYTTQNKFFRDISVATSDSASTFISTAMSGDSSFFDGIKVESGNTILSLLDNAVYEVGTDSKLSLLTVQNNNYIHVLDGLTYKNTDFIKSSGSFITLDSLQKIVSYLVTN